jgi:DnaK suppressor protein
MIKSKLTSFAKNASRFSSQEMERIKTVLLRQKQKVEADIKALEDDDPVLANSVSESSEPGTDSWMADVHGRAMAVKESLRKMLVSTTRSLEALKTGKYGKCEKCGKPIEVDRLKAMPTATVCIMCSKK